MAAFLDNCRFNPTLGGTTDWTYSSGVAGYQSPAAAGAVNGTKYKYFAIDGSNNWELGEGAYNTTGPVLPRTTITANSLGTTAKINFAAAPQVAIVAIKADLLSVEEANSFTSTQQAQARTNLYAAPFDAEAYNGSQINGSQDVSQELAGTQVTLTSASTKYVTDQWLGYYQHAAATAVFKAQQVTPPGSPSFGAAFPNCLQLTATTALSAPGTTDFGEIYHYIEGPRMARYGWGNANGQSMTVGFWVYATIAGTASLSLRNSATTRSYVASITINNALTWEYKTATIPPDTTGTWLTAPNTIGAYLAINFGTGATYQTTVGAWQAGNFRGSAASTNFFATANNTVCMTGLIMLPGSEAPTAARSPFIMRPFDDEIIRCQRFFCSDFPYGTVPADNVQGMKSIGSSGSNTVSLIGPKNAFPVAMKSTPAITLYSSNVKTTPTAGQWQYFNNGTTAYVDGSSTAVFTSGPDGFNANFTTGTITVNASYIIAGSWKAAARF